MEANECLDKAIELLVEARNYPEAKTHEEHVERSQRRYELLHMASEIIVLDCIDAARYEAFDY